MSERPSSSPSPSSSDAGERYDPFDRLEARSGRLAELLVMGGVVAGLGLVGGRPGVVAGLALLGCWMYLRVELTVAVGAVLLAAVGDVAATLGVLLVAAGLTGLLAVDLARTWGSVRPAALFHLSVVVGVLVGVPAYDRLAPGWFAAGGVGLLALGSYALYRYDRYLARPTTDDQSTNRRSDGR